MKTTFICLMALGLAAAMAAPMDRAFAGEPMVLTDAQLDQVTAGALLLPAVQAARESARRDAADVAPNMTSVEVDGVNFLSLDMSRAAADPTPPGLSRR